MKTTKNYKDQEVEKMLIEYCEQRINEVNVPEGYYLKLKNILESKMKNAICSKCGKDRGFPEEKAVFSMCASCLNDIEKVLSNSAKKKFKKLSTHGNFDPLDSQS